jgi:peptidyl-prolyl cis-trans isomerase C
VIENNINECIFMGKKKKSTKGQIRASHILVPKYNKAMEVIEKIKSGIDFADVAKSMSECPSKKKGGDLGFFGKGQMVKEFEDAVSKLSVGQMVNEPVKTKFGYHVIKRTG